MPPRTRNTAPAADNEPRAKRTRLTRTQDPVSAVHDADTGAVELDSEGEPIPELVPVSDSDNEEDIP